MSDAGRGTQPTQGIGAMMVNSRGFVVLVVFLIGADAFSQQIGNKRGEDLPLYYDFRNGNVTIDTTNVEGNHFVGYGLQIPFDGYIVDSYTPFMSTQFVTVKSNQLGESNISGGPTGVYSLGNILPSDLSQDELNNFFGPQKFSPFGSSGEFRYTASAGAGSQTYHAFEPHYAPSPFPAINDTSVGPSDFERWAEAVTLTYTQQSGRLGLDTSGNNGGMIWSYEIQLWSEAFELEGFAPLTDGLFLNANELAITEIGISGIPEGSYSLGRVLPPGLSEGDLKDLVRRAVFVGEPGHGSNALDMNVNGREMALTVVIPEPQLGLIALLSFCVWVHITGRYR